jgi:F420-0:gamma-glutamyl ligase
MLVKAIKTRPFIPPKDDLLSGLTESFFGFDLKENSIIAVTSKVVSIWQGRCLKVDGKINKDELIKKEADLYLEREETPENYAMLTVKDNILIPTAGIDESNAKGYFILWPEKPYLAAKKLHEFFLEKYNIKNLGIIITDSHCTPLRTGTMGMSIAYYGFYPLRDYRNKKDIFGRELKMSQLNLVDSLAVLAVLNMGEGKEQTPIAVIEDVGDIKFGKFDFLKTNPLNIKIKDDIYWPLLKGVKWKRGNKK